MAKDLDKRIEDEELEGAEENLPEETKKDKKAKKPGRIRKFCSKVYHGVRDNPVTAVVCTAIGIAGTLAVEAGVALLHSRKGDSEYSEPIEIDDLGETNVDEETDEVADE